LLIRSAACRNTRGTVQNQGWDAISMMPDRLEAVLLDFDHTLMHMGQLVRWEDARHELLPLYRASGGPEPFLQAHAGALKLYGEVAACGLLPAATTFVRRLPELGLRAGIVTSNAVVVSAIIARGGLTATFDTAVGRDDVRLPKPSPEGLLRCCEAMGVTPQWCSMTSAGCWTCWSDGKRAGASGIRRGGPEFRGVRSPRRRSVVAVAQRWWGYGRIGQWMTGCPPSSFGATGT